MSDIKTDDSEIGDYLNYMEAEMGKTYFEKHFHRIVNLFFGIDSDEDLGFERHQARKGVIITA